MSKGNGKQAVLLIHGIGNQMPMDTLRAFVKSVWEEDVEVKEPRPDTDRTWWSKPDTLTENYDLRRITTVESKNGLRVDFFEFYWAHLMHGTQFGHFFKGMFTLLFRNPVRLSAPQAKLYCALVAMLLAMVGIYVWLESWVVTFGFADWLVRLSPLLLPLLLSIIGGKVLSVLGDAPRYLHKSPDNLHRRHEIQRAGIDLLRKLHEANYERIIVVGHSLGSVVGYDILTDAWAKHNKTVDPAKPQRLDALEKLEEVARAKLRSKELKESAAPEDEEASKLESQSKAFEENALREAQRAYHLELRANGNTWRVTDFITLGSPLAHAEVLLAKDKADLQRKIADRELATCLPCLEEGIDELDRFSFVPRSRSGEFGPHRFPHHAALFGPTRWTNIYFPMRCIAFGDLVGGPLQPVFGKGVKDVPVWTWRRFGLFTHTCYWQTRGRDDAPEHIKALRAALGLAEKW